MNKNEIASVGIYEPKLIKLPFSYKGMVSQTIEDNINEEIKLTNSSKKINTIKSYKITLHQKLDNQNEIVSIYNTDKNNINSQRSISNTKESDDDFFDTKEEIPSSLKNGIYTKRNQVNGMNCYSKTKLTKSQSVCDIQTELKPKGRKHMHKFSLREKLTNSTTNSKLTHSSNNYKTNGTRSSIDSLYNRGIEMMKRKEERCKEEERKKKEEYKTYSFKPKINKSHRSVLSYTPHVENNIYKRQEIWKNSRDNKISSEIKNNLNKEIEGCTFKPKINGQIKKNDIEFIQRHLFQIVSYVKKRQDFLLEKENKVKNGNDSYSSSKKFTPRKIITKKRVNSSINFNTPNSKSNKIEDVCKIRNELGLSSFFDSHNINDFINIS